MIFVIGGAYQGKLSYVKDNFGEDIYIINQYHLKIREFLKQGKNPVEETKRILLKKTELVIICDEVGYGVVPMDKFEREYREMVGRVGCLIAGYADNVIRVVSGIGVRIK